MGSGLRSLFAVALLLAGCTGVTLDPNGQDSNSGTALPGDGDGDNHLPGDNDDDAPGDDDTVGDGDTPGDGDGDNGGDRGGSKPDPSKLPKVNGPCPELKDGSTVDVGGAKVVLAVGSKPGPVYLYFHGTGTLPAEVELGIPGATKSVRSNGGLVASWQTSNGKGLNTGTIWYTGDIDAADQLIACAMEKNLVDTSRIHVAGYSAGGLETGTFIIKRAHYVASAIVYSGGRPLFVLDSLQGNLPSVVGAHGAPGADWLALDFGTMTPKLTAEIAKAGGFAIDCNDGGIHIDITRLGVGNKALDFFRDHPFGVQAYKSGLPSGWPSHCKIVN